MASPLVTKPTGVEHRDGGAFLSPTDPLVTQTFADWFK